MSYIGLTGNIGALAGLLTYNCPVKLGTWVTVNVAFIPAFLSRLADIVTNF